MRSCGVNWNTSTISSLPRVTRPREPFNTQCLVGLLDASALRGASAAITTADQNVMGLALRHPCCNDTNIVHELQPHASVRIRILAIEIDCARASIE